MNSFMGIQTVYSEQTLVQNNYSMSGVCCDHLYTLPTDLEEPAANIYNITTSTNGKISYFVNF